MGSFNDLMGLYYWIGNEPEKSMEDLRKNRLRKEAEKSLKTTTVPKKRFQNNSASQRDPIRKKP